ncbi:AMP-binding protein [Streptomyces sp. ODS28]|uniref:AMP-binding protein n=1 Tax=Streptomyces sp. ODS28 TaxID=3136688 RepID=UPI0031E54B89
MTDAWKDLIGPEQWRSRETVWVENETEYSRRQVGELAAAVEDALALHGDVRVAALRAETRLGFFAGQLGAWRAGCVAVADDGTLGPDALGHVRPDVTLAVRPGADPVVEEVRRVDRRLRADRIPEDVVAVNFTSGSTGSRKAVAVTRGNLIATFADRGLDVKVEEGELTAGSFATPAYDGWWFDTWRTVAAGGRVVCLPHINEDVFAWPELAEEYGIDRVLLPAAVVATVVGSVPECIAGIPWVFSGGEQFQAATYRQAREAGLTNRFVNLYGPTEATFATHRYDPPEAFAQATMPIGTPLDGCRQSLQDLDGYPDDVRHLVVSGPLVCAGYLEDGELTRPFPVLDGHASYRTGDMVREDGDGNLVFAGRLDSEIKVNGKRVDAAALEREVASLPDVLECRVAQDGRGTVAFVRHGGGASAGEAVRADLASAVRAFSPAIRLQLVDAFPTKPGGKIDFPSLMNSFHLSERVGEK